MDVPRLDTARNARSAKVRQRWMSAVFQTASDETNKYSSNVFTIPLKDNHDLRVDVNDGLPRHGHACARCYAGLAPIGLVGVESQSTPINQCST